MELIDIEKQAAAAARELCDIAKVPEGGIVVVGCSSSEIVGEHIGKGSSLDAAKAVFEGMYPILSLSNTLPVSFSAICIIQKTISEKSM